MAGVIVFFVTLVGDRVTPGRLVLVFAACALPMVAILVFAFVMAPRSRAESAAGYTTSTRGHQNLDQVDPVTGFVIRRAGSAVLTLPGESSSSRQVLLNESSFGGLRFVETRSARRAKLLSYGGLGVFVVILLAFPLVGLLTGRGSDQFTGVMIFACFIGAVVLMVGVLVMAVSARSRAREKAAAAATPGSVAFTTQRTPELLSALKDLGDEHPRLGRSIPVTVGPAGIELWGANPKDGARVSIPWGRVTHVHPGKFIVAGNKRDFTTLAIHVFQEVDGRSLDVPLPIYGRRNIAFARADQANTVLDAFARFAKIA
jgi:hypothetical protein